MAGESNGSHFHIEHSTGCHSDNDNASKPDNFSCEVEDAIAELVHSSVIMLTLQFMEGHHQQNTNDCGVFAIANAAGLSFESLKSKRGNFADSFN